MRGRDRGISTSRRNRSARTTGKVGARRRWGGSRGDASHPETAREDTTLRRSQIRFAVIFLIVAAVLFVAYSFPYQENGISERWFQRYLSAYARLAGFVLGFFDRQVSVAGNVISGHMSLKIVKSCDAMEANLLFVAAVAAWPARWHRKLVAGAVGLVVLVVVNVVRICSLYFVGARFPAAFEFLHIDLWPFLIIVVAIAQFVGWAVWMQRVPAVKAAPVGP
jgi:exosortase H (IPTLxxWG-CTERM-specific)